MKRRTRTLLIIFGVLLLLIVIVVLNLKRSQPAESVTTDKVKYGSILSTVSATGELRAQDQVNLQAQVMGVVDRLLVEEGDNVHKGDLLLALDRKSYEAQLVLARARYTQAGLSFARVESLYRNKLVSAEQYEGSKATYEMAKAQNDEAEDQYAKTQIRAPISGTVVKVNVKQGETVILGTMNNPGTVIMVLADMSKTEARIEVDETDVVSVVLGQTAMVHVDALPDTAFAGNVTKVGYMPVQSLTAAETQGTDFEVIVTLDSTVPALRPGMTVSVDITTASLDSVLVIPIQAVGRRELEGKETQSVFVLENGKATLKQVKTGRSSDTDTQIVEGLNQDDEVITGPYKVLSKLKEGRRVTPSKTQPSPSFPEKKKPDETTR